MRTSLAALMVVSGVVVSGWAQQKAGRAPVPPNPKIDMDGYLKLSKEAAEYRKERRVTEDEFLTMAAEKGTIVLDARSKAMYDLSHAEGAINLNFSDIAIDSLQKALPDKEARILIYCNNNIKNSPVAFAPKAPRASLNLSTFIALYGYGYKNVYELGPVIDPANSKIKFVATEKAGK